MTLFIFIKMSNDDVVYISVNPNDKTIEYMRQNLLTGKALREMFENNDIAGLRKVVPEKYFGPLVKEWDKAHADKKENFADITNQRGPGIYKVVNNLPTDSEVPYESEPLRTPDAAVAARNAGRPLTYPHNKGPGSVEQKLSVANDVSDTHIVLSNNKPPKERVVDHDKQTYLDDVSETLYTLVSQPQTLDNSLPITPSGRKPLNLKKSRYYEDVVKHLKRNEQVF